MRRIARLLALCLVGLVSAEVSLRIANAAARRLHTGERATLFAPFHHPNAIVPDERLYRRPALGFVEHDELGYRNARVLDPADIVALGDSQTYGLGVDREEAWPQRLADMTGRRVYQIASSGWSPTEELELFADALDRGPSTIIATLYFGNDLYDSWHAVYRRGLAPHLRARDAATIEAMDVAERRESIEEAVARLVNAYVPYLPEHAVPFALDGPCKLCDLTLAVGPAIVGARHEPPPEFADAVVPLSWTVLTPQYRRFAVDDSDPRIAEGLRVALLALAEMRDRAAERGIRFLVLLIPTKERVIGRATRSAALDDMLDAEERALGIANKFLAERGIRTLDAAPALRAALSDDPPPYYATTDGHPAPNGHGAIAAFVRDEIAPARALRPITPFTARSAHPPRASA